MLETIYREVKREWPVLKQAKMILVAIVVLAFFVGSYGGFKLADYVTHERIETLQTLYENEKKKSQTTSPSQDLILQSWGGPPPFCVAQVNGARLGNFQDKYSVAAVCGLADASTDRFSDTRISVSPLFIIRRELIPMNIRYGKEMAAAHEQMTEKAREALKGVQIPKEMNLVVSFPKWYEVILPPKRSNVSAIRRLSDVSDLGGKILSQEGYAGASAASSQ